MQAMALSQGINKEAYIQTVGCSEDQYYSWMGNGKNASHPSLFQTYKICSLLDWSPTYILFGVGPQRLSEVIKSHELDLSNIIAGVEERHHKLVESVDNIAERLERVLTK